MISFILLSIAVVIEAYVLYKLVTAHNKLAMVFMQYVAKVDKLEKGE